VQLKLKEFQFATALESCIQNWYKCLF